MTMPRKQKPVEVGIDVWVFMLILVASAFGVGVWYGIESQTEVRVIRIPDRVTPSCIQKGVLKQVLHKYRKEVK